MQGAEPLVAVHGSELGQPHGQLPVGPHGGLVDQHVEGAVHRLDEVARLVAHHLRIHVVDVFRRVPRRVPQHPAGQVRALHDVVAALEVQVADVVLELLAEDAALRMPHREPRPELLGEGEQVELAPQLAVVAPLGLLQPLEMLAKILLRGPRRPVDALEHRLRLVAAPVRAGERRELEGAELLRGGHVRPQAQIAPAVVAIDRDGLGPRALRLVESLDDLALVRLPREALERLLPGQLLPNERLTGRGDLAHALLDAGEVLGGERLGEVEVVVEAVLDGRPDRVLGLGDQVAHRLGQDMRCRVAEHVQPVRVGGGHGLDGGVLGRDERKVAELAVHAGGDRAGLQRGAHGLAVGQIDATAVGKLELGHARHDIRRGVRFSRHGHQPRTSHPAAGTRPPNIRKLASVDVAPRAPRRGRRLDHHRRLSKQPRGRRGPRPRGRRWAPETWTTTGSSKRAAAGGPGRRRRSWRSSSWRCSRCSSWRRDSGRPVPQHRGYS